MSTDPTFSPRVIGQAEKTLNAILGRQLAGTGLTEPQWVILTLAVTSGETAGCEQVTRIVAGALKISETQARAAPATWSPRGSCDHRQAPGRDGHRCRAPAAQPDRRRHHPDHPAAVGRSARR
jgi:hypothetical protein